MPAPEVLAYPLLLGALYGVYRVGRARGDDRAGRFELLRLAVLALGLGLVAALQVRFAADGRFLTAWSVVGGVLSVAAIFGLVGLHLMDLAERWPRRHAPPADA